MDLIGKTRYDDARKLCKSRPDLLARTKRWQEPTSLQTKNSQRRGRYEAGLPVGSQSRRPAITMPQNLLDSSLDHSRTRTKPSRDNPMLLNHFWSRYLSKVVPGWGHLVGILPLGKWYCCRKDVDLSHHEPLSIERTERYKSEAYGVARSYVEKLKSRMWGCKGQDIRGPQPLCTMLPDNYSTRLFTISHRNL